MYFLISGKICNCGAHNCGFVFLPTNGKGTFRRLQYGKTNTVCYRETRNRTMKKSDIHSAEELALPQAQTPEKGKTEKYVVIVWLANIL